MSKQDTAPARPVRVTPRQTPTRATATSARPKRRDDSPARKFEMPFEAKNIQIILLGVLVVGIGYLVMYMSPTMSFAALTLSPIILLLGYFVVIPYGIMKGARTKRSVTIEQPTTNGSAS